MNGGRSEKNCANAARRQEFERLSREHIDSMWRTALRMTGNHDVADDLTQEAFLKAYVAFDQFKAGTNYKAWIFRILTNLCRDYLRRENRSPVKTWDTDENNATLANSTGFENQPDLQLQQGQFYTDALDAIACLSPELRLIVCLSLLEELTYQEIADVANIPIGTVRSRLSSGRKRLKGLLKAHVVNSGVQSSTVIRQRQYKVSEGTPFVPSRNRRAEVLK